MGAGKGSKHPPDCNHCAAIRGDKNPAKRPEVRKKISDAASTPEERARRSAAVSGELGPSYNASVEGSNKAAHHRVLRARGKATDYECAGGCGRQAVEWALNKSSTSIRYGKPNNRGQEFPYSMNIDDYDPLCMSCHRKRDARRKPQET